MFVATNPSRKFAATEVEVNATKDSSPETIPFNTGDPETVAPNKVSYSLSTPERPVMVNSFGETVLLIVATFIDVAPDETIEIVPE